MKVLVIGGTGLVGSQVVRELSLRGAEVQVLTRDLAKAKNAPAGVATIEGNLLSPASVRQIFKGAEAVFLLNALSPTEAHEGLQAICGMKLSDVKRIVYLSVHQVDLAPHLPHFGAKIAVENALRHCGIPFTILRPNHFFQNDYLSKDALLQANLYTQPLGNVGMSRVDVRDIAEAAAIALLTTGHEGKTYDLVGPEILTGNTVAQIWSRALGREIRYVGDDMDAWEKQALQYLPDWLAFDVRLMFEFFHKHGLQASPEAVARLTELLGHAPRSFEPFAKETATMWAGAASTAGAAGA